MNNYYLKFQQLKDKANELISMNTELFSSIPVDIDLFAEFLGLDIIPSPGFKDTVARDAFLSPCTKEIYVDQDLQLNPKFECKYRFAISHEIAHYHLHTEYYKSILTGSPSYEDWIRIYQSIPEEHLSLFEYQANVVGACILIPDHHLDNHFDDVLKLFEERINSAKTGGIERDSYLEYVIDGVANKISPKFNVSVQAMILRFKDYRYKNRIP